jgi:hypothetical protein
LISYLRSCFLWHSRNRYFQCANALDLGAEAVARFQKLPVCASDVAVPPCK